MRRQDDDSRQLVLWQEPPSKSRELLVVTSPRDTRRTTAINLGLQIAAKERGADVVHWSDPNVEIGNYDRIGFNVYYPLNILNIEPFLRRYNLGRPGGPVLQAGGHGVSNLGGVMDAYPIEVYRGEIEGHWVDRKGYHRAKDVLSEPVRDGSKAIMELTRGCRYSCNFCEYGCTLGGSYREKPLELAKEQLIDLRSQGITRINLLSVNMAGYRHIEELIDFCKFWGITILNADTCIKEIRSIEKLLPRMAKVQIGLESFDERTRIANKKGIPDELLWPTLEWILEHSGGIYFYLIFGLPDDNYGSWWEAIHRLADIRRRITSKSVRFDFSISTFEPSLGTPLEGAPWVDFEQRTAFKIQWAKEMHSSGLFKKLYLDDLNKVPGIWGKEETTYRLLMHLKRGGQRVGEIARQVFKNGVTRSPSMAQKLRFLTELEAKK